jgi:transketolase N-terminal domain/subunit
MSEVKMKVRYGGELSSTKVMLAEYLALICVTTGRMKDKLRVQMLMTSDGFSMKKFMELLAKFKLTERFELWKIQ